MSQRIFFGESRSWFVYQLSAKNHALRGDLFCRVREDDDVVGVNEGVGDSVDSEVVDDRDVLIVVIRNGFV